jgi:putative flavoprotein involved in K+ transport
MMKRIETVVIGAGQCGLALSACLWDAGREHIVLERGQVAQAWRDRWGSLTLLSPNRFTRLPRYAYRDESQHDRLLPMWLNHAA